ncbi:hepatitis A virus cellular receptor 2 homolog [Discoglossus pictus]
MDICLPWICIPMLFPFAMSQSVIHVKGSVGDTLHLPCTYPGVTTSMCWGRGYCPVTGCNNAIIWTDGSKVIQRNSDRYQLRGNIQQHDVSLTITGVTISDAGTYCCRVEIPGPFNDLKKEMTMAIREREKDESKSSTSTSSTTKNHQTYEKDVHRSSAITTTMSHLTQVPGASLYVDLTLISKDGWVTSLAVTENKKVSEMPAPAPYITAAVIPILLVCLVAGLVYKCKFHKRKVETSRSSVPMEIQGTLEKSDNHTVDNIYIMD